MRTAAFALLLSVVGSPAFALQTPGPAEGVDAFVLGMMKKHHVPGVSVAVVQNGKVVLSKGYGLANVELDVPATPETVYQLASVTKTFTATAVMMLVKEGKLSLDDKVTERLADLPESWGKVTVRHLLNHTSGIKSYTSVDDFSKTMRKDYARREILDLVAKAPLEFAPGEKWSYDNTGYFLLGLLIEKVAGKPYGEFLADRVFRPLGMTRTRANDLREVIPGRAQGYEWDDKALRNGEYLSPTQPYAAGMLVSNVADMVKWDAALRDYALIDSETQESMWQPTKLGGGGEADYGFGWSIDRVNGRRRVSHGGGIPGFSTQLSRYVDDGLTVIVLTNSDSGHAEAIAKGVAGRFVPTLAEKELEPIADEDPVTTKRLRALLEATFRGEVDAEAFTEEARKSLVPRLRDDRAMFAAFGALKSFDLLERKAGGDGLRLRYRAVLENETLRVMFGLDQAGKIRGIGLQTED